MIIFHYKNQNYLVLKILINNIKIRYIKYCKINIEYNIYIIYK